VVTNKITECRIARKISKADLARRIHRSRAYVTQVEKGILQPGGESMLRIARYFGKPVEEIFQFVEAERPLGSHRHPGAVLPSAKLLHKTISSASASASGRS
jgi:putative transcriptional regulator